jgi:hypothetical protein
MPYSPSMKRSALASGLLAAIACGPDATIASTDDGDATGTTAASTATASTIGPDDTSASMTVGVDSTAEDTAEPEPLPPPPATGLQIVDVTLDQGLRIPIAIDGVLVDPAARDAVVLQGREAALRGFYDTDPGFATRFIYGELTLEHTDGTTAQYEAFAEASEPEPECEGVALYECRYGLPDGALLWRLAGEDVRPGTRYRIALYEAAPGHENDVSSKIPVFPTDGDSMEIGVADSYMKMRVVVVPFYHDAGPGCAEAPDLLEEFGTDIHGNPQTVADYFGERLAAHNPVDEVEILVHDVVSFNGNAQQGQGLLDRLQQLRFQEDAPPEQYYYGVIRPCQGAPDFSGIAQLGGPSPGLAAQRVGWGVYHGSVGTTAGTFVHEIGHEQGRFHIACSGEEGGPDVSYPDHPEGDTESWGIDVMMDPITIKPPSAHDYMTYCGSTWVGAWGWQLVSPWIEEISSWERAGAPGPERPLLVGTVRADGSSSFYVAKGFFDEALTRPGHAVRFYEDGALVAEQAAQWVHWERSEDVNVVAPLPTELSRIDALRWHAPGRSGSIDRAGLQVVGALASGG